MVLLLYKKMLQQDENGGNGAFVSVTTRLARGMNKNIRPSTVSLLCPDFFIINVIIIIMLEGESRRLLIPTS